MNTMKKLKLSISNEERAVVIECSDAVDIHGIMDEVRGLLIAWGYHPNSVMDGFSGMVEEE